MLQQIELSDTEILLVFAASCVEGTAQRLGVSYREVYDWMKRVEMIGNYIIPYYDVLHTMSREHVIDDMLECLKTWEENV